MKTRSLIALAAVALFMLVPSLSAQAVTEGRLMRFPDIHKDKIVFVYAGDLWLVPSEGGTARRLTTHVGLEWFPKFSPDGEWIAFSGEYDGNTDVYVIPANGGEPKRLTYHPGIAPMPERFGRDDMVLEWYPEGTKILFRSWRDSYNTWFQKLFSISVEGGLPEELPLPMGGLTSFSPEGTKMAYNRIFRNFRTWKRYKGGLAQDIWIYDLEKNTIEQITDYEGTDSFPMWQGDRIYFTSDRDHTTNIFCYDLATKAIRKITHHTEYDVNWPSLGPGSVVYENGGYLYVLDLPTEQTKKLTVYLPGDRVLTRPEFKSVSDKITDYNLSPSGKRALFGARGEIFTVPAEKGNTRNLTNTPGVHEKYSTWSPDGRWISYVSDRTGEDEIYIIPQDGQGEEIRITTDGHCYRFIPVWSPDSNKLLYADKSLKLYYVNIETKKVTQIDQAKYWEIRDYGWSPDSKWVAYAKPAENGFYSVCLYSLDQKKIFPVTTDFTDDSAPVFDPEGKYLYFLSKRDFNPLLGEFEMSFTYNQMTRIYLVTLQADTLSPFAPESDEEKPKEEGEEEEEKKKAEVEFRIDIDGIQNRIVAAPLKPANYGALRAAEGKFLYLSYPSRGLGGTFRDTITALHLFDMKEKKDHILLSPVDGYDISGDGEKIVYKSKKQYGIIDAKPNSHKIGDGALNLGGMQMKLDPRAEWKQMFDEAWRLERDYFYDPNLHGVDWERMHQRYGQLLPWVSHRSDLTYIIGEMIGELCCSHTYVGGGDMPKAKKVSIGLLGIDWEADEASGFYRIKKIYQGENWNKARRSPLTEPGVGVKEGEYVIGVDGHPLRMPTNPYSLFENTVDKTITLTVNSQPTPKGAREVTVKPVGDEYQLRYLDWVEGNRRKVDQATNGRVGYIYLPNMSTAGLNEFAKTFYPQIRKEGLIIDVRYNGGGFVSQMIIERLRRVLGGMVTSRNAADYTYPSAVFYGHLVCLINHYSASDGDIFPYYFRQYGLGPLIGTRTWGGIVGIRGYTPLVDGGYVTRPEFSKFSLEGEWIMENQGVEPDIEVDNRPDLVVAGHDPQLEKAIEVILKKIEEEPRKLPERPVEYPRR
ncbi:MAG: S41 family peptidase [bacterium]